jgi:hypothetical protein
MWCTPLLSSINCSCCMSMLLTPSTLFHKRLPSSIAKDKPTQQAQALAALVMPCWHSCPTPACRPAEPHVRVMRHSSHTDMHSPMHVQLAHASASVHVYMQATSAGKAVTLVSNKWQPLVKQEAYSTARHLVSQGRCLKRVTITSTQIRPVQHEHMLQCMATACAIWSHNPLSSHQTCRHTHELLSPSSSLVLLLLQSSAWLRLVAVWRSAPPTGAPCFAACTRASAAAYADSLRLPTSPPSAGAQMLVLLS